MNRGTTRRQRLATCTILVGFESFWPHSVSDSGILTTNFYGSDRIKHKRPQTWKAPLRHEQRFDDHALMLEALAGLLRAPAKPCSEEEDLAMPLASAAQ